MGVWTVRWEDLKALLVSWYDGLADFLRLVEEGGRWPAGSLDAFIAMIPEADGMLRRWAIGPDVYCLW